MLYKYKPRGSRHSWPFLKFFITAIALTLGCPIIVYGLRVQLDCEAFRNGIYYMYPKNSSHKVVLIRQGETDTEIDLTTGDTTLWTMQWKDCKYFMKYVSGMSEKLNKKSLALLKKNEFIYQITDATSDYYVFKGYFGKKSTEPMQLDTVWLHEKIAAANNELFRQVPGKSAGTGALINDTSKYALLYVYRKNKFAHIWSQFPVYLDDNLLCISRNNTGYVFQILKEGKVNIRSKLLKDTSQLSLDIKFGKTYYVEPEIIWTITPRLYNYRLAMTAVDPAKAQAEFDKLKLP